MVHSVFCIILLINIQPSVAAKSQSSYYLPSISIFLKKKRTRPCSRLQSQQTSILLLDWKHMRGGGGNGEMSDSEPLQSNQENIIFNTPLDDSLFLTTSSTHHDAEWSNHHAIHTNRGDTSSSSLDDTKNESPPFTFQKNGCENRIYPVSICSIQGRRQYMEDEYFTNSNGSFCSVMDGHGGSAVSKYLRQNLYARYLQAKATANLPRMGNMGENVSANDTLGYKEDEDSLEVSGTLAKEEQMNGLDLQNNDLDGALSHGLDPSMGDHDEKDHVNLRTCILALKAAFEKIDAEVQKISHWSYQGSTAVAVKLHKSASSNNTVLISANVGDSRAVLCRAGKAIELTRDHKPNDPDERRRIEGLGGKVEWFGRVDDKGRPLERNRVKGGFSGVYRINRNLSLSRAIGDRSELPFVCSTVDISCIDLDMERDSFIILATDGLWDVFDSSQEVMHVCQQIMDKTFRKMALLQQQQHHAPNKMSPERLEKCRNRVSKQLVREALRRGSLDNITVIIIWL